MYDSIRCTLYGSYGADVLGKLKNPRKLVNTETGEVLGDQGSYYNFHVRIFDGDRVEISGSLTKYYYGNNIQILSLEDAALAIEKLKDELNIPLQNAYVYSVHIAVNVLLKSSKLKIHQDFGRSPRKLRKEYNTSLLLHNRQRSICLYDKLTEQEYRGIPPEEIYAICDRGKLLRIELQLKRALKDQINNGTKIQIKDILEVEFLKRMLALLKKEYFKIERNPVIKFTGKNMIPRNTRELAHMIQSSFISQEKNYKATQKMLQLGKRTEAITGCNYYRMIDHLGNLINDNSTVTVSNQYAEIDDIVKRIEPLIFIADNPCKYYFE